VDEGLHVVAERSTGGIARKGRAGGVVNDPDSRGRTCVSPRTTDYERATL